jgi:DNA (cytosine-5)-methyltransferase 1
MTSLCAVSLFAGIGGFGCALARAGVSETATVEIDDAARGVLADRFPHTTRLTDVKEVTGDDFLATGFDPEHGILTAGWPCQGNSVAGRRGGMADPRSGLWVHVARLLAELRPRWFIGENVPGLLSVNGGRDFGVVIDDLGELGYGFCWRVLDAQFFGVPQRRRRVFIVGHLGDGGGCAPVQVLLEPEGSKRDSAPGGEEGPGSTAGTVVGTLTGGGRRGQRVDAESAAGGLLVPVGSLLANGGDRHVNDADAGRLVPFDAAQVTSGENRSNPRGGDPAPTLADTGRAMVASTLTTDGMESASHNGATVVTHALTAEGADASEDGTGRGTPLAVGNAAVRRLTPLECERLQGFPDGWTLTSNGKLQSDSARYRQLGNAVAVPVVEWIARRVARVGKTGDVTT